MTVYLPHADCDLWNVWCRSIRTSTQSSVNWTRRLFFWLERRLRTSSSSSRCNLV